MTGKRILKGVRFGYKEGTRGDRKERLRNDVKDTGRCWIRIWGKVLGY